MLELSGVIFATKYLVDQKIGAGGMGVVYRAHHLGLGRLVALKIINEEQSTTPESYVRFQREAMAASRLDHPNVIRVLDFGVWEGTAYIVMEYIDGSSLSDVLRVDGRLTPERACRLMLQVLDAVAAAHDSGVIHRDVKPSNIMLVRSASGVEVAKLCDFGVAKLEGEQWGSGRPSDSTTPGLVPGTPAYLAPELRGGHPPTPQSDVYACGLTLYKLLTGELPKSRTHIAPPSAVAPLVDVSLDRAVLAAVDPRPEHRTQSAHALRAQLATRLDRPTTITRHPPAASRSGRVAPTPPAPTGWRSARATWLAAGALLVCASASFAWTLGAKEGGLDRPPQLAETTTGAKTTPELATQAAPDRPTAPAPRPSATAPLGTPEAGAPGQPIGMEVVRVEVSPDSDAAELVRLGLVGHLDAIRSCLLRVGTSRPEGGLWIRGTLDGQGRWTATELALDRSPGPRVPALVAAMRARCVRGVLEGSVVARPGAQARRVSALIRLGRAEQAPDDTP